ELAQEVDAIDHAIQTHRAEKAQLAEEASSLSAQTARVTEARKRLAEWRETHAKKFKVEKFSHAGDRFNDVGTKKPRMFKRLAFESGLIRSTILIKNPATGEMELPKTEEERRVEEMEKLRIQVIESQKRKEAAAAMQRLKEKELREQVLKSMKAATAPSAKEVATT
ncbi:hypothetical protein As57867_020167, partial [Aphanomyces stellatus]